MQLMIRRSPVSLYSLEESVAPKLVDLMRLTPCKNIRCSVQSSSHFSTQASGVTGRDTSQSDTLIVISIYSLALQYIIELPSPDSCVIINIIELRGGGGKIFYSLCFSSLVLTQHTCHHLLPIFILCFLTYCFLFCPLS